jgi:3',5'-cyclic AMP phosphodiesterase CpdA
LRAGAKVAKRFRVLHVSDFHIGAEANRRHWKYIDTDRKSVYSSSYGYKSNRYGFHFSSHRAAPLEDLLRLINDKRNGIDMIFCTGDLSTTGKALDLRAAHEYFEHGIHEFGPFDIPIYASFIKSKKSVLLMPGNHDRYASLGQPGSAAFQTEFRDHWQTRNLEDVDFKSARKGDERVAVVAADFSLRTSKDAKRVGKFTKQLTSMGQGRCYDAVVTNLKALTKHVRENYPGAAVVWAIHYPIYEPKDKKLDLLDKEKIQIAAKEMNVTIVLGGHIHQSALVDCANVKNIIAGSCSAVDIDDDAAHEAHIINFEVDGGKITFASREDLVFDRGMFVKVN